MCVCVRAAQTAKPPRPVPRLLAPGPPAPQFDEFRALVSRSDLAAKFTFSILL